MKPHEENSISCLSNLTFGWSKWNLFRGWVFFGCLTWNVDGAGGIESGKWYLLSVWLGIWAIQERLSQGNHILWFTSKIFIIIIFTIVINITSFLLKLLFSFLPLLLLLNITKIEWNILNKFIRTNWYIFNRPFDKGKNQ